MRRVISLWFPNLPIERLRRYPNAAGRGEIPSSPLVGRGFDCNQRSEGGEGFPPRVARSAKHSRSDHHVTPAKAGVQSSRSFLDSGSALRAVRNDGICFSREHPLVLTAECAGQVLVTAVNAVAAAAGIAPGMALADARALQPRLVTRPADPAADAAMLDELAAWCGRYTPWTAPEGRDGVWLDVSGCAHLLGGERAMLDDLLARLGGFGLAARAVLADTPGAAWALARYGASGAIVPPGAMRAALAALPVAALRLGPAAADGLTRLGLRRIGDLYALPRAPLAARFGREVARRLDQALGREAEPVSPRRAVPRHRVRLSFPEPIGRAGDIAAALDRLLQALCEGLRQAGRGCQRLDLTCCRADGSVQAVTVGTARPARDAAHLARLFVERLDTVDPGFGIESMILSALHTEPMAAAQAGASLASSSPPGGRPGKESSSSPPGGRPAEESFAALAPLLDRLGNRFGFDRVAQLNACASHLPERACRLAPAAGEAAGPGWRPGRPRPLRLLARPEPVEVETGLLRNRAFMGRIAKSRHHADPSLPRKRESRAIDHPWIPDRRCAPSGMTDLLFPHDALPEERAEDFSPCAFRWRRVRRRICAAEGPERVAPEWWRADPAWAGGARDYWRVEDAAGQRFWLFREVHPCRDGTPRWFLHGLFV